MDHKILGTTMPVLEITLPTGESVISEGGELSWMTSTIEMTTSSQLAGAGGMFGALKRMASGGSYFMTQYTAQGAQGMVAFATRVPGEIIPVDLSTGKTYMAHRHGFLCGTQDVQLNLGFQQKLGAGVFGGEGFALQKISGSGTAWVEIDGELVTYDLAAGEVLRVQPGHVGMFEESVAFDITRIKGIKNMLFGADTVFLAELTGPGRVWLQSLPIPNLAHALRPYLDIPDDD